MRILHIINNLSKGGAERLLSDTLPLYRKKGLDVTVLLLSEKGSAGEYINHLSENGVAVLSLKASWLYSPLLIQKIRAFIQNQKPDIVHVHLFPSMYWTALAKSASLGTKIVFTEHSTKNTRMNLKLLRPVERLIYRRFDRIIAISPAIATKLERWTGRPDKVKIIRNGIDISKFQDAEPYHFESFSKEMDLPENAVTLLMTARFSFPKDHKTIIDALRYLPENFIALFVGEGEEQASVKKYAEEQKLVSRIRFLGFRNDVSRVMKTVDINILSSLYEGMSGVTCEALASGKPFFGTDVPGINDIVPDGRYLFKVKDSVRLAEKITEVMKNPALGKELVYHGLEVVDRFSVEQMIDNTVDLYRELTSK